MIFIIILIIFLLTLFIVYKRTNKYERFIKLWLSECSNRKIANVMNMPDGLMRLNGKKRILERLIAKSKTEKSKLDEEINKKAIRCLKWLDFCIYIKTRREREEWLEKFYGGE